MCSNETQLDNVIVLQDENGDDCEFEFLDLVELNGNEYVVLLPVSAEEEEESGEVVILQIEDIPGDEETESYVSVDNEADLLKVFETFKEKFKDEFDFAD